MTDTAEGARSRVEGWLREPVHAWLAILWAFLIAAALTVPVDRKGDGSEYILATESLLHDADLVVDNTVDIFRHLERRPYDMDTPAGLTRIQGVDGVERYGLHSFYYPLVALPFYAAFGYPGFHLLNAGFVGILITAVYAHLARTQPRPRALSFAALAVLLSASWSYVFWTQAETMYAALLAVFLQQWLAGRPVRAAAAFGVVVAAQPALGLFAVPMLVELLLRRSFRDAGLAVLAILAWVAPQLHYNVTALGTVLPMSKVGLASAANLSLSHFLRLVLDPAMGLVWFHPAVVFCLLRMKGSVRNVAVLAVAFAVLYAMTAVHTFYSHQVGSRYGTWVFPAFLFLVEDVALTSWPSWAAAAFGVTVGAGLAIDPLGNSRDMDIRHKSFLPYRVATALGLQVDDPEVFRTSSTVLVPDRVYVRKMTRDGWTRGGERVELLLFGVQAGDLVIDVRPWAKAEERQRVLIETLGGQRRELLLDPGELRHMDVTLRAHDVEWHARTRTTYTILAITAEPWVPAIEQQGDRPEAHDLRRLGVLLERIATPDKVLWERAATGG